MRRINSISDFVDSINSNLIKPGKITKEVGTKYLLKTGNLATRFAEILKSSKGRDKIFSFFEHFIKFNKMCLIFSNDVDTIKYIQTKTGRKHIQTFQNIQKSIGQSRKVFRFAKFLEEIEHIAQVLKKKKKDWLTKSLMLLIHICTFIYNFLDNIVWFHFLGIINELTIGIRWKTWKNLFILIRSLLKFIVSILEVKRYIEKEYYYSQLIEACDENVINSKEEIAYSYFRKLLTIKWRRRLFLTQTFQNILKLLVCSHNLNFIQISSTFSAGCGLYNSIIAIMKIFFKKTDLILIPSKVKIFKSNSKSDLMKNKNKLQRRNTFTNLKLLDKENGHFKFNDINDDSNFSIQKRKLSDINED